ncbi:MAG: regulatory protein RecX [Gammaproteobacteria bacterium]|nr:regulatory protein RecX [Gammaproteobacteria bacterium]
MTQSSRAGRTARRVAMDCLARREHSENELRRKLASRDFTADEIDATLSDLVREGLASDARFAEAFAANRASRGQGPVRIRVELEARGVAAELIDQQLRAHDWVAAASEARDKRFGGAIPADYREWARQARFLQNRGFTSEQVRAAFGNGTDDD